MWQDDGGRTEIFFHFVNARDLRQKYRISLNCFAPRSSPMLLRELLELLNRQSKGWMKLRHLSCLPSMMNNRRLSLIKGHNSIHEQSFIRNKIEIRALQDVSYSQRVASIQSLFHVRFNGRNLLNHKSDKFLRTWTQNKTFNYTKKSAWVN